MPRTLSADDRAITDAQIVDQTIFELLIFTHENLSDGPLRIINNTEDATWEGDDYLGWPFKLALPDEGDRPPKGTITIQNVSRKVGEAMRSLRTPARVRVIVVPSEAPSDVWIDHEFLFVTGVSGDAEMITGTIGVQDQTTRLWPKDRATQAVAPGVYR